MSLEIYVYKVRAVLLVDGWHTVLDGTFTIDTYDYYDHIDGERRGLAPPRQHPPDVLGYAFKTGSVDRSAHWIKGPLAAVQAVELDP